MDRGELIDFIIHERVACFFKNRSQKDSTEMQEERSQMEAWEASMKGVDREVMEQCQTYLNWLLDQHGKELEECYLFGVEDGVRLMKMLKGLLEK